MQFVGRQDELSILENCWTSHQAEFLAVYGRRRVGKTFLIRQFFQDKKDTLFFNATGLKDGSIKEQTANFIERIGETFYGGATLEKTTRWREVFKTLTNTIQNQDSSKKIVIFLDEIPWMATPKSNLLQALDYYWNQYWSLNPNIKLIICGSSASWIIRKIIHARGGLHNRITEKICLEPFTLSETKEYLHKQGFRFDHPQIVLLYMVTGGVPFYLSKIKWKSSAMQIIVKLAFVKKAFFLQEFDDLFSSLFKNHETHIKIVTALATHRDGVGETDLLSILGPVGGNNVLKLKELEDAGFIMRFKPLYHKRKGIYYRLIDEYSFFYLKWVKPLRDVLQQKSLDRNEWQALQLTPEWQSWLGYAFEMICYKHLLPIKRTLHLPPLSMASTWRYVPKKNEKARGAQIDLLFDRRDKTISICEIKYSDKPFLISKEYYESLNRKLATFKEQTRTKKQLSVCFISANGLASNAYSDMLVDSVVTIDNLFE